MGRYDDVAHHTIYLAENYKQNLRDIEEEHRAVFGQPSFYVQNASVTDPTLAPKGHSTLYVLLPVTHECPHVDWAKETPRFRDLAIKQMEAHSDSRCRKPHPHGEDFDADRLARRTLVCTRERRSR